MCGGTLLGHDVIVPVGAGRELDLQAVRVLHVNRLDEIVIDRPDARHALALYAALHVAPRGFLGHLEGDVAVISEEHTSDLQPLMRTWYAVFFLITTTTYHNPFFPSFLLHKFI